MITILILLLSTLTIFGADVIPSDRVINWSRDIVGVPGGIPNRTNIFCNVRVSIPGTNIVAVGDGSVSDVPAIQAAINLCPSNQVVYIPAGDYVCSNAITISKSGITIRGDGTNTILRARLDPAWSFLQFGGYITTKGITNITSGATKGSTNIVVPDLTGVSTANNSTIYISQTTDYDYVHRLTYDGGVIADPNNTNIMSFTGWVTATNSDSITFWPPLPMDLTNSQACYYAQGSRGCMFSGIEDLKIIADQPQTFNVYFDRCYGCWVKNIESAYCTQAHFYAVRSVCCEVRDSYFHDFWGAGGGNNGEGIEMYSRNSGFLVENNIVYHCFPGINTSGCSSASVIAYNYVYDAQSGSIIIGNDFDANHGSHNVMNLWEGNVGGKFQSDGYYGSASHVTAFRNYFSGTHPTLTYMRICVDLTHWSTYFNIVGNVLGEAGWTGGFTNETNNYSYLWPTIYRFGYPGMGNNNYVGSSTNPPTENFLELDYSVKTTVYTYCNYDYYNNGIPDGSSNALPNSLYLTEKPAWFGNVTWPPIDPLTPTVHKIPAQLRFENDYSYTNAIHPPLSRRFRFVPTGP